MKEKLYSILKSSYAFMLAIDEDKNCITGFVNALSDGLYFAFIPMLEVKPE